MNTCSNCGAEFFRLANWDNSALCSICKQGKVETRAFSAEQLRTIDKIKAEAQNEEDTL